jgi:hypothetical protein
MIDSVISSLIGQAALLWLIGFGVGKVWAFVESIIKRATGTY